LLIIEEKKLCLTFTDYERNNLPNFSQAAFHAPTKNGRKKNPCSKRFSINLFVQMVLFYIKSYFRWLVIKNH